MKKEKITCDQCGIDFHAHSIIQHNNKAYCHMCDFQFVIDQLAETKSIHMPSYFINKQHYRNFMTLTHFYSKVADPFEYKIAAYINAIPSIFDIYPKQHSLFIENPLIWQFDWNIYQFVNHEDQQYFVDLNPLKQNIAVNKLIEDYQLILKTGYHLFTWKDFEDLITTEIETYKDHTIKQLNAASSRHVVEEIFELHLSSKGG